MLKAFLTVLIASSVMFPALAQPPQTVEPQDRIELAVGESRTLEFQESFQTTGTATEGTARIVPQSDRTLTVTGIAPGQTTMFVQGLRGELVYMAAITVAPSPGHLVKLYGHPKVADFIGVYCTETGGCGRADPDKPDDVSIQTTTVTKPTEGGGTVSTTKQYGPK